MGNVSHSPALKVKKVLVDERWLDLTVLTSGRSEEVCLADEGRGRQARVGPIRMPDYLRPVYANYVNVNHTPWDFRLVFAVVTTSIPGEEQPSEGEEVVLHPAGVAEVIVPANLMHGFISALQDNFSKYLESFGPPGLDPQGPGTSERE
jgi:hypothetical protein